MLPIHRRSVQSKNSAMHIQHRTNGTRANIIHHSSTRSTGATASSAATLCGGQDSDVVVRLLLDTVALPTAYEDGVTWVPPVLPPEEALVSEHHEAMAGAHAPPPFSSGVNGVDGVDERVVACEHL